MEISRPIFIIGVPRSGTTLLYNLMAHHKDLAWFSQYDLPKVFSKEFLHFYKLRKRLFDIREWSYGKLDMPNYEVLFDAPIEFPQFWNRHIGQDWADEKDVDDSSKKRLRETISQIIISKNKKRFLSKYPRNSVRIRYLNKVFPGSIFVNIVRDGIHFVVLVHKQKKFLLATFWDLKLNPRILIQNTVPVSNNFWLY